MNSVSPFTAEQINKLVVDFKEHGCPIIEGAICPLCHACLVDNAAPLYHDSCGYILLSHRRRLNQPPFSELGDSDNVDSTSAILVPARKTPNCPRHYEFQSTHLQSSKVCSPHKRKASFIDSFIFMKRLGFSAPGQVEKKPVAPLLRVPSVIDSFVTFRASKSSDMQSLELSRPKKRSLRVKPYYKPIAHGNFVSDNELMVSTSDDKWKDLLSACVEEDTAESVEDTPNLASYFSFRTDSLARFYNSVDLCYNCYNYWQGTTGKRTDLFPP